MSQGHHGHQGGHQGHRPRQGLARARRGRGVRHCAVLAAAAVLTHLLPGGPALDAAPLETTATRLETPGFLVPPSGFDPPTPYTISDIVPIVDVAAYALPDTPANPWSHWGPSTVLPDGRVLSSLGDHLGVDANSYLYEYDPATRVLRQTADLQSAVADFEQGDFGFGKIHGRLSLGNDGQVYLASYWGQWQNDNEFYEGDRLFRYDPDTHEMTDLGMPEFGWGYPSTHMAPEHNLFYAEAFLRKFNSTGDPDNDYLIDEYDHRNDPYIIEFFVYDLDENEVTFKGGHEGSSYGRDFFVDADGNAYFNNGNGTLVKYDVNENDLFDLGPIMPGSNIRRTAGPDADGILYATTNDTHVLFSFDPDTSTTTTITDIWSDTASMTLDPTGRYIYMVPGSHGPHAGVPLLRVDVDTGDITVMAFLAETIMDELGQELGGSYSLSISDDGNTLYLQTGLSADEKTFLAVTIPEPASAALLGLGLGMVLTRRRERHRRH